MADDLTHQVLGRICASCDGSGWRDVNPHRALLSALEKVPDSDARMVLTDLVGFVAVLERKIDNIYVGTAPFKTFVDEDFQKMLDEQQQQLLLEFTEPTPEKLAAFVNLADTLNAHVREHDQASRALRPSSVLESVRTAVAALNRG